MVSGALRVVLLEGLGLRVPTFLNQGVVLRVGRRHRHGWDLDFQTCVSTNITLGSTVLGGHETQEGSNEQRGFDEF